MNLIPFEQPMLPLKIQYAFTLKWPEVFLSFKVTGDITDLQIPATNSPASRRNELWNGTCFEFFIKDSGQKEYFEFNLSPSSDWNFYHLSNYREGLKEDPRIPKPRFEREQEKKSMRISTVIHLGKLPVFQNPIVGIACIMASETEKSYWALKHPDTKPNFHHEKSFCLNPLTGEIL